MKIIQLQLSPWDKIYTIADTINCQPYNTVVVKTELGLELAQVLEVSEAASDTVIDSDLELQRLANVSDLESALDIAVKNKVMQDCHNLMKNFKLPMKLVDLRASIDGSRYTFAFVANGRIDFRDLVKDLTRHFNKTIRLQQIGIRDEAKMIGDQGRCGLGLCCRGHLQKFTSVTGDMAEVQNLSNRGSDRLSGSCGRLMCCLAYEADGYKASLQSLPALGTKVSYGSKGGQVIALHALKQAVDVRFPGEKGEHDYVLELPLNSIKY
jgi:cell fate regulator YaaT (PSP1 superfamily)